MKLFIIPILLLMGFHVLAQSSGFDYKLAPPLHAQQKHLAARAAEARKWTLSLTDTAAFRRFLI